MAANALNDDAIWHAIITAGGTLATGIGVVIWWLTKRIFAKYDSQIEHMDETLCQLEKNFHALEVTITRIEAQHKLNHPQARNGSGK